MGGIVKLGNYIYTGTTAKKSLVSVNIENGLITDSLSYKKENRLNLTFETAFFI
jgi:hypothetical protein